MEEEKNSMQIACKQVSTVLRFYNQELLKLKIPEEVIDKIQNNASKDYEYNVTPETFDANTLTEEASAMLLVLFEKYFANQDQKEKIDKYLNPQNYTSYDINTLFKRKEKQDIKKTETQESNGLIVYKQNIINKIIKRIKLIFQRQDKQ